MPAPRPRIVLTEKERLLLTAAHAALAAFRNDRALRESFILQRATNALGELSEGNVQGALEEVQRLATWSAEP